MKNRLGQVIVAIAAVGCGWLMMPRCVSANPVSEVAEASIEIGDSGDVVDVSFLGMWNTMEDANSNVVVQWREGENWNTAKGSWSKGDTEQAESGSGLMVYTRFSRQVACPAQGEQELRLAFRYVDDEDGEQLSEWTTAEMDCVGVGPGEGSDSAGGCSVSRSAGAPAFSGGFLMLVAALFLLRRQRA